MLILLIKSEDILKTIGKKIKKARMNKNYTQDYLSEKIGISTDLLRNIENSRNVGSLSILLNLCNALDITPNFLFAELLNNNHDLDNTLYSYFQKISTEDKDILKDIIIHLDKNYKYLMSIFLGLCRIL